MTSLMTSLITSLMTSLMTSLITSVPFKPFLRALAMGIVIVILIGMMPMQSSSLKVSNVTPGDLHYILIWFFLCA